MTGYPKTMAEFERLFKSEEDCWVYLCSLRWPKGFRCFRCESQTYWKASRYRMVCAYCGHQTTPTAGTIFHRTRLPLKVWFRAIEMVSSGKGISARQLLRELGLGSYETAWVLLHKLRRVMGQFDTEPLFGRVGVSYAPANDLIAGTTEEKKLIVIIVGHLKREKGPKIRVGAVKGDSIQHLQPFVNNYVQNCDKVYIQDYMDHKTLKRRLSRDNMFTNEGNIKTPPCLVLYAYIGLLKLKRWLNKNYHGVIDPEHLDYYLSEFSFLANRYAFQANDHYLNRPVLRFKTLLLKTLSSRASTYSQIIKDTGRPKSHLLVLGDQLEARSGRSLELRSAEKERSNLRYSFPPSIAKAIAEKRQIIGYATGNTVSRILAQWGVIAGWAITQQYHIRGLFADLSAEELAYQPDLEDAVRLASEGKATLVVSCLSDLSMTLTKVVDIIDRLSKAGAFFVALKDKLDTDTSVGSIVKLISAVEGISRKSARSLLRKTRQEKLARQCAVKVPYGMKLGKDGNHIVSDVDEMAMVEYVIDERQRGRSYESIAGELRPLKVPSPRCGQWSSKAVKSICEHYENEWGKCGGELVNHKCYPRSYFLKRNIKIDAFELVRQCVFKQLRTRDEVDKLLAEATMWMMTRTMYEEHSLPYSLHPVAVKFEFYKSLAFCLEEFSYDLFGD